MRCVGWLVFTRARHGERAPGQQRDPLRAAQRARLDPLRGRQAPPRALPRREVVVREGAGPAAAAAGAAADAPAGELEEAVALVAPPLG